MFNNHTQMYYGKEVKSYEEWTEFIASGRKGTNRRKIANNTYVIGGYGAVMIRLHDTDVVTVNHDGTFELTSGGWQSVTTKERLNRYTPAGISQKNGIWYMRDGSLFYDGIVIDGEGKPLNPKEPTGHEAKMRKIKKEAREYARGFVEALKAGEVDFPSAGDCWHCAGRTTDGQILGDAIGNTQHIRSHIEEKYYVPSLLVNAGRAAGYQDHQIGLMGIGGHSLFISPEENIYKYIVKQLGKEVSHA